MKPETAQSIKRTFDSRSEYICSEWYFNDMLFRLHSKGGSGAPGVLEVHHNRNSSYDCYEVMVTYDTVEFCLSKDGRIRMVMDLDIEVTI